MMRRPSAFTLVELVVVMAIVAVLSVVVYWAWRSEPESAELKQQKAEIQVVKSMIETQKLQQRGYPTYLPNSAQ